MSEKELSQYEVVNEKHLEVKGVETILPSCADLGSAGDDFYSKNTVTIQPKEKFLFWTDVKAKLQPDEVLYIFVRSSVGIHRHLMLANTVGVIDSSYYNNERNDGNIGLNLYNYGEEPVTIEVGERIAQGVVHKVAAMANRSPLSDTRAGGSGSSGK